MSHPLTQQHAETAEALDHDLNGSSTAAGTGALGSGGHQYNQHETNPGGVAIPSAHAVHATESNAKPLGRGFWLGLLVAVIIVLVIVVYGIHSRSSDQRALVTETRAESVPEVKVIYPVGGSATGTLALPGNMQAFVDTPIYARTSGYLKRWYFDIGAHVRKGQLMATIETPELDQQLQVAQADLQAAQANYALSQTTAARYTSLLKSNSVSRQETDVAVGDEASKAAAMKASEAGVRRLQQLQSFEQVYAPFSGVVTARNTDIGALITGGVNSGSSANQLFRLASTGELRVFVSVPEAYSTQVRDGGTATLTLDEFPGQNFSGIITRNAGAIDPASRTLNVEVDVPNSDGKLLPGSYATVHFNTATSGSNLTLPSNTLLFRAKGTEVGVVRNGRVQLVPVKIAADHGATVEIGSGVTRQDAVILDPSDSLTSDQKVKIGSAGATK